MSASAGPSPETLTPEERLRRAEAALAESLEERNRLWADLHLHRSKERELAELRLRLAKVERSGWWRAGKPLRRARRAAEDPALAAAVLLGWLRRLRRRLSR